MNLIGFDHRHIAEEAIHILRGDQANLPRFDHLHELGHAFALANLLRSTHSGIGIDHVNILA